MTVKLAQKPCYIFKTYKCQFQFPGLRCYARYCASQFEAKTILDDKLQQGGSVADFLQVLSSGRESHFVVSRWYVVLIRVWGSVCYKLKKITGKPTVKGDEAVNRYLHVIHKIKISLYRICHIYLLPELLQKLSSSLLFGLVQSVLTICFPFVRGTLLVTQSLYMGQCNEAGVFCFWSTRCFLNPSLYLARTSVT